MEKLSKKKADLSKTRSVASVFVSRIDTAVDKSIDEQWAKEKDTPARNRLLSLKGKAAVANSALIFHKFGFMFSGKSFSTLSNKNCQVQRVLWGSTGTKNPQYSDIKYITELIARPTVNTLPEKTINAFLDHGVVKEALTNNIRDAQETFKALNGFGIDTNKICEELLTDGVSAFEKSFDALLNTIETKARTLCAKS